MTGFLAYIIPIDGHLPPGGGQPPQVGFPGGPAFPTNPIPIYPGGSPNPPGGGGQPGNPPGFWGGGSDPSIGNPIANAPGVGHHPGQGDRPWQGPGFPTNPIVIPPTEPGQPPLVIWGPNDPRPTPPINLPPGGGSPPAGGDRVPIVDWHTVWSEQTGWAVIGVASGKHVTPSSGGQAPAQQPAGAPKK